MSHMPRISGREVQKALEKVGFEFNRQRGSHISVSRSEPYQLIVVPDHREVNVKTLRNIIRDAGLTVDEFKSLLR